MVDHLGKVHGIGDLVQRRGIANKWRHADKKKAWACGFCGHLFLNFQERLKHIGTQHFERQQGLAVWDDDKVIQGLLTQPGVDRAWQSMVSSLSLNQPSDITWQNSGIKDLQYKLELGPCHEQTAEGLAQAAYNLSNLNRAASSQSDLDRTSTDDPTKVDFISPMESYIVPTTQLPGHDSLPYPPIVPEWPRSPTFSARDDQSHSWAGTGAVKQIYPEEGFYSTSYQSQAKGSFPANQYQDSRASLGLPYNDGNEAIRAPSSLHPHQLRSPNTYSENMYSFNQCSEQDVYQSSNWP